MQTSNRLRLWAVLFWLLLWQLGSMALGQTLLLPSPFSALRCLAELAVTAAFWRSVSWSALRIMGGFLAACTLAVLAAIPAARHQVVRELLTPLVAVVKATPVASFIILALVWLNSRVLSFSIAFLMVFPPVYLNVLEGICRTDRELQEMARVFRIPLLRQAWGIYLPAVLPYFRTAVTLGLGLCWKSGIAAEIIGVADGSMGERLYMSKIYFQTPELFAWTIAIVAVSVTFEKTFLFLLDRLTGKAGF